MFRSTLPAPHARGWDTSRQHGRRLNGSGKGGKPKVSSPRVTRAPAATKWPRPILVSVPRREQAEDLERAAAAPEARAEQRKMPWGTA